MGDWDKDRSSFNGDRKKDKKEWGLGLGDFKGRLRLGIRRVGDWRLGEIGYMGR